MYHAIEHMRRLLEAKDLPVGNPPEVDGPGPDPELDAYLFDGSRRLALLATGDAQPEDLDQPGRYTNRELDDPEAEEIARALRVVVEARPRPLSDEDRDAFLEVAVEEAMDEWDPGAMFGDPPGLRHQIIEDVVRDAWNELASSG